MRASCIYLKSLHVIPIISRDLIAISTLTCSDCLASLNWRQEIFRIKTKRAFSTFLSVLFSYEFHVKFAHAFINDLYFSLFSTARDLFWSDVEQNWSYTVFCSGLAPYLYYRNMIYIICCYWIQHTQKTSRDCSLRFLQPRRAVGVLPKSDRLVTTISGSKWQVSLAPKKLSIYFKQNQSILVASNDAEKWCLSVSDINNSE